MFDKPKVTRIWGTFYLIYRIICFVKQITEPRLCASIFLKYNEVTIFNIPSRNISYGSLIWFIIYIKIDLFLCALIKKKFGVGLQWFYGHLFLFWVMYLLHLVLITFLLFFYFFFRFRFRFRFWFYLSFLDQVFCLFVGCRFIFSFSRFDNQCRTIIFFIYVLRVTTPKINAKTFPILI